MLRSPIARARTAAIVVLSLALAPACSRTEPAPRPEASTPAATTPAPPITPPVVPAGDFTPVVQLVDAAIAAPRMPGAVVQIGHGGKVVFRQAF